MRSDRPPGADLPAPYESPWRRLAGDLRAVAASLRLRLWELGRRNGQGDLWRPRFWPESLAALFWPLLLGLLLLVVVGLGARLSPAPGPPAEVGSESAPLPNPDLSAAGSSGSLPLVPAPELPAPEVPAPLASTPGMPEPQAAAPKEPDSPPPEIDAPLPLPPAPPPLLGALAGTPGAELLRDARAEPARALLVLQVDGAYGHLPAPDRAERAQAWWQRAQELGYERLELLGPGNGLLGRSAVVGGGLVLYEPPPGSAADPA